MKGNVVDLAVAVIIGAAFGKVIGGVNFSGLFIYLDPSKLAKDGSAMENRPAQVWRLILQRVQEAGLRRARAGSPHHPEAKP